MHAYSARPIVLKMHRSSECIDNGRRGLTFYVKYLCSNLCFDDVVYITDVYCFVACVVTEGVSHDVGGSGQPVVSPVPNRPQWSEPARTVGTDRGTDRVPIAFGPRQRLHSHHRTAGRHQRGSHRVGGSHQRSGIRTRCCVVPLSAESLLSFLPYFSLSFFFFKFCSSTLFCVILVVRRLRLCTVGGDIEMHVID